jgi:hypothetical protein
MQSPLDWVMHPETMLQIISECKCTVGVDAELCLSVRSPAHAAEPMGAVRSLVGARLDQLFGAGPVQQHAGVPECFLHWIKARCPAILLRHGRERFCRDPIGHRSAVGSRMHLGRMARRFRRRASIVLVAEGTPGAVPFTSSGRVLPGNEVRIASDSGAASFAPSDNAKSARFWSRATACSRATTTVPI